MEKFNSISEMFGFVEPNELLKYIQENWRTINFISEIRNSLVKFQVPVKANLATRKEYECIRRRCEYYISIDQSSVVSGHFGNCNGGGR